MKPHRTGKTGHRCLRGGVFVPAKGYKCKCGQRWRIVLWSEGYYARGAVVRSDELRAFSAYLRGKLGRGP